MAEIASVRAREFPVRVLGIFDPGANAESMLQVPVWRDLSGIKDCDAFMLTALERPQEMFDRLREINGAAMPVRVPEFLAFVRKGT